jgi:hypothetical protein
MPEGAGYPGASKLIELLTLRELGQSLPVTVNNRFPFDGSIPGIAKDESVPLAPSRSATGRLNFNNRSFDEAYNRFPVGSLDYLDEDSTGSLAGRGQIQRIINLIAQQQGKGPRSLD